MNVSLLSTQMEDLLPMTGRTQGVVHLSNIIHDLCVRLGYYQPGEADITRFQLGSALEHAIKDRYRLQYPDRFVELGELEHDGVFCTPDLFDMDTGSIHEVKLTWMSSRHEPDSDKFAKYWWQVLAYTQVAGAGLTPKLHVGHINGDYKGYKPQYRVWERTLTRREIEGNWTMLMRHRDVMLREGWLEKRQDQTQGGANG